MYTRPIILKPDAVEEQSMPTRRSLVLYLVILAITSGMFAADEPKLKSNKAPLAHCGELYSPPFEDTSDAWQRPCFDRQQRHYAHRHPGIGFEILDAESEACFVPDEVYQLLDSLIDQVEAQVHFDRSLGDETARHNQALEISQAISDTMAKNGFGLYIPTDTLGDALLNRAPMGQPQRHIFDCDTGSFVFLTISDSLQAPVSLVDITLPSGDGHNYVQWRLDNSHSMNWDMNGRAECITPPGLPSYEGRPMTREQTLGYALALRAKVWERRGDYSHAITDYQSAMQMYSDAPIAFNNFAWLIATKDFPERGSWKKQALQAAIKATSIEPSANYLDTLACAYAYNGNLIDAVKTEKEALIKSPGNHDFTNRLTLFESGEGCTGSQ
jgi:tetratricopeptide (TPR) repeat protein